jgi:RNA polymerase sigma factor (sigma-70 family)
MPVWRDDKILELANQLTYSPEKKRREELHAAIELLPHIDPARSYPWDFVHFRITSFQPRAHSDHFIPGKVLRADLATLVEFLSDTLSIKVEDAGMWGDPGDSVLAVDEVSRKFNVSGKTIQRWRKQGLLALRYVYADGRRRLGFLESAIARFAEENKERVERSASFKQLSEDERTAIIRIARELLQDAPNLPLREVAQRVSQQMMPIRSAETVRYAIRRHDHQHPEAALFPQGGAARKKPQLPLFAPDNDAQEPSDPQPHSSVYHAITRTRACKLKTLTIEFMPNPLYHHPDADTIILSVLPQQALARAQSSVRAGANAKAGDVYMARVPRDLPAFLQDIFRQPVMPQELEIDAFRRMNYLKYRAQKLQNALDVESATPTQVAEIETLLLQASEIKNLILQSNLRVAVHVARKHQRVGRALMELVSDATIWLMRAVEKYDFARPARFSTYASYAIMKNFARDRAEQLTRRDQHMVTGQEEILAALGSRDDSAVGDQIDAANLQSDLLSVIEELPDRERELLTHHYGLDQSKPALSLAEIGDKMGITKARVRQLEARALRQLRALLDSRREKLQRSAATPAKSGPSPSPQAPESP